jgi:hypothetical protein
VERSRVRPDALPLLLDRVRVVRVHLGLIRLQERKSLSRERPGGIAAASPRSVPALSKELLHRPKTVPGRMHACSISSPTPLA